MLNLIILSKTTVNKHKINNYLEMKLSRISLIESYKQHIASKNLEYDDNQIKILKIFDEIKHSLELKYSKDKDSRFQNPIYKVFSFIANPFFKLKNKQCDYSYGLYLYSSVGRGKTMLMDLFFNNIAIPQEFKFRIHFHLFMRSIHNRLQSLSGMKEPIEHIIANDYSNYKLICLDEFMVHDISDAMVLVKILENLIKNNIVLVTTSNIRPDDLYKKGLQRRSFLPAIDLIKTKLKVKCLDGSTDYRANMLLKTSCYFTPNNFANKKQLDDLFNKLSNENSTSQFVVKSTVIEVASREINVIKVFDYTVWFDFNIICNSPRANADYLEIAEVYKVVFISNLYQLNDSKNDIAKRFINLIDILYDYKVKLIICSDVDIDSIYSGSVLEFEFERTISRLKEMQSNRYLSKVHL